MLTTSLLLAAVLSQTHPYSAKFISCYDADTCTFDIYLGMQQVSLKQKVRFCDIDAPELRPLVTRQAATEARNTLRHWLALAKVVEIRIAQKSNCDRAAGLCDKKDSFGRWLAFVYADGVDLNAKLLELKLAEPYPKKCLER